MLAGLTPHQRLTIVIPKGANTRSKEAGPNTGNEPTHRSTTEQGNTTLRKKEERVI